MFDLPSTYKIDIHRSVDIKVRGTQYHNIRNMHIILILELFLVKNIAQATSSKLEIVGFYFGYQISILSSHTLFSKCDMVKMISYKFAAQLGESHITEKSF